MDKNKLIIALADLEYYLNQFRSKMEVELNDLEEHITYVKQLLEAK